MDPGMVARCVRPDMIEPQPGLGQSAERVLPTVGAGQRCTVRWRSKLSCQHENR